MSTLKGDTVLRRKPCAPCIGNAASTKQQFVMMKQQFVI
jgi:hypothetical protein